MGKLEGVFVKKPPAKEPLDVPGKAGSDESKLLAALEQMDGIISGVSNRANSSSSSASSTALHHKSSSISSSSNGGDGRNHINSTSVLSAAQALSNFIQQCGNVTPVPDPITAGIINTWLDTHLPNVEE